MTKICINCGKEFSKPYGLGKMNWDRRIFCSKKCRTTGVLVACKICGKKFWRYKCNTNKRFFCSQKCYHKSKVGKPNLGHPNKGHTVTFKCSQCGKEKETTLSAYNRSKYHFCNQSCWGVFFGKLHSGSNHYKWVGGTTEYPPTFNEQLRARVRVRDNFVCRVCDIPELECSERLSVHHIDHNKENNDMSNLISLCKGCHTKTTNRKEYWMNYFKKQEVFA